MARVFISHSSENNAEAIALRDWLIANGWDDLFLDLDPDRGIVPGERWQDALHAASQRCELVLFLLSPAWVASDWCRREFWIAKSQNKRLLGAVVDPVPEGDLPGEMTAEWQLVDLTAEPRTVTTKIRLPKTRKTATVSFSEDGLARLRAGLQAAGLDAKYFPWPPDDDPERPPYRGLRPLEAGDAGIFFGRDGAIVEALDRLRGLRETTRSHLVVILGASGSGKSSFLRAGLLPRLARDDRHFLSLPIVRPGYAAISGETGLIASVTAAFKARGIAKTRASVKAAIAGGGASVRPLLRELLQSVSGGGEADDAAKPATLILPVDQGEELYVTEGSRESEDFLTLLDDLLSGEGPALLVLVTIRSDAYERLQLDTRVQGLRQQTLSLPPMPRGAYADVITGPAMRLEGTHRPLKIEEQLTDALLTDIEDGGAKDALPLLAFTLERLFIEYGDDGDLKLSEYDELGRIKGSIEAAVERALLAADSDPAVPRDRKARLDLLRRGLIPWLAGIDPDTGEPRRRVARLAEIPQEARPLIDHLVEQRLLATDVARDSGEVTIEPAHEALLRQWGLLEGWLEEDFENLTTLEGVKRAARDWAANGERAAWLSHSGSRLAEAERIAERPEFKDFVSEAEQRYMARAREAEQARVRRERFLNRVSRVAAVVALIGGAIAAWQWWEAAQTSEELLLQTEIAEGQSEEARRQTEIAKAQSEEARRQADIAKAQTAEAKRQAEIATAQTAEAKRQAELAEKARSQAEAAQRAERAARDAEARSRQIAEDRAFDARMRAQAAEGRALLQTNALTGLKRIAATMDENLASGRPVVPAVYAAMFEGLMVGRLMGDPSDPLPWLNMASSLTASPDGERIVLATVGLIYILDREGRMVAPPIAAPSGRHSYANYVAWNEDGTMFAVASGGVRLETPRNAALRVYNREGELVRSVIENHEAPVLSVAFIEQGSVLLAGDQDGRLVRANLDTGETTVVASGQSRAIHGIAWTQYGLLMATGPERSVTGEPETPDEDLDVADLDQVLSTEPATAEPAQETDLHRALGVPADKRIERVADSRGVRIVVRRRVRATFPDCDLRRQRRRQSLAHVGLERRS